MLETLGRHLSAGSGLQNLRGDAGARSDLAERNAVADFVEDRAQKRGGGRVEHELTCAAKPKPSAVSRSWDSAMLRLCERSVHLTHLPNRGAWLDRQGRRLCEAVLIDDGLGPEDQASPQATSSMRSSRVGAKESVPASGSFDVVRFASCS